MCASISEIPKEPKCLAIISIIFGYILCGVGEGEETRDEIISL